MIVTKCDLCKKEISERDLKHKGDRYLLDFAKGGVHVLLGLTPRFTVKFSDKEPLKDKTADLCLSCRKELVEDTLKNELPLLQKHVITHPIQEDDDL